MKLKTIAVSLGLATLLTGCGTLSPAQETGEAPPVPQSEADQPSRTAVPKSTLDPQELAPKECGLFLWSQTDPTRFVFFKRAGEGVAKTIVEDQAETVQQVAAGGAIFGQFFTVQTYQTNTGREVHLTFVPGETLEQGQRIASGRIQYVDDAGWLIVLPVVGVRVCQPAVQDTFSVTPDLARPPQR